MPAGLGFRQGSEKFKDLSTKSEGFSKLFGRVVRLKVDNADASKRLLRLGDFFHDRLGDLAESAAHADQVDLETAVKELVTQIAAVSANVGSYIARPGQTIANSAAARIYLIKNHIRALTSPSIN